MEGGNRKFIIIAAAAAAAILFALFYFGSGWAESFYYGKGVAAFNANNFSEAKKNFERATFWGPRDPRPYAHLGRIALGPAHPEQEDYFSEAKFSDAIPHYEKALALGLKDKNFSFYGTSLELLGLSYWMTGEYDKADEVYLERIKEFPDKAFWPRYLVALDYVERLNKAEEALEILSPAPLTARNDYDLRYSYKHFTLLARIKLFFEHFPEAKIDASQAIKIGKDSSAYEIQRAHAVLAVIAGKEKNFAEAEKEIARANALAGKPIFNCTLSRAYAFGENYKKAAEIAMRVLLQAPGYGRSICLINLAQSKLALGEKTDAKKYFEQYLGFTDGFKTKNIFTMRDREIAQKELEKLSASPVKIK